MKASVYKKRRDKKERIWLPYGTQLNLKLSLILNLTNFTSFHFQIILCVLLAVTLAEARAHPSRKVAETTAPVETKPSAQSAASNDESSVVSDDNSFVSQVRDSDVIAQVQAAVAAEEVKESQAAAAVQFEISRAQEELAAQNVNEALAADTVRQDAEEALAVMAELKAAEGDLMTRETGWGSGYSGGWGQPGWGGYNAFNGWNGIGGGYPYYQGGYYGEYSGYNPYRRSYVDPYYNGKSLIHIPLRKQTQTLLIINMYVYLFYRLLSTPSSPSPSR